MAFFDWEERFSVGIEEIDTQHKRLFELINNFYNTIQKREVTRAIFEVLEGMTGYTQYHFSTEEDYMKKYKYPLYASHHAEHEKFVEKVADFRTRLEEGKLLVPVEIANFLKNWLAKHILESDQQFAPYFKEKGVK